MESQHIEIEQFSTDFIIIGSGIAGLYTALNLSRQGRVSVFCKRSVVESNTWYAQGGIAAAFGKLDSPGQHLNDTLKAGAYFGDKDAIKIMVEEGPLCIKELQNMGVKFDRSGNGFALGKEGAHTQSRILRIGGDATGRFLVQSLYSLARENNNIFFHENSFALELIADNDECRGVRCYNSGKVIDCFCKAVILATGGGGIPLFAYNES